MAHRLLRSSAKGGQLVAQPPRLRERQPGRLAFRIQHQVRCEAAGLEGLEHRPDVQKRVDPFRCDGNGIAIGITDTLPAGDHAAGNRLGHDKRLFFLARPFGQRLDNRVVACGDHDRGGDGQDMQAQASSEIEPFRRAGKVETDHGQ